MVDQADLLKINIDQQDSVGRTPLIIGCHNRNEKLVRALLMKNVDVEVCTFEDKNSGLHWACLSSHERICKWVLKYALEKKVSESKNSEGQTAQEILMSNPETVDWINDILNVENEQ